MLISNHRKFIFIHIPKNAGTSITNALYPFALNKWQKLINEIPIRLHRPLIYNPRPYVDHITAAELLQKLSKSVYDQYYTFAVVRNPWAQQVSLYTYMLKRTDHFQHNLIRKMKDFEEYITWRCKYEPNFQKDVICSAEGELLVNFVARYETVEDDFKLICNRIGIATSLPKSNTSNARPYQEFYSAAARQLVEETFEEDIEFFGYQFE